MEVGKGETRPIVNNVSSGVNLKDKLITSRTLGVIRILRRTRNSKITSCCIVGLTTYISKKIMLHIPISLIALFTMLWIVLDEKL